MSNSTQVKERGDEENIDQSSMKDNVTSESKALKKRQKKWKKKWMEEMIALGKKGTVKKKKLSCCLRKLIASDENQEMGDRDEEKCYKSATNSLIKEIEDRGVEMDETSLTDALLDTTEVSFTC